MSSPDPSGIPRNQWPRRTEASCVICLDTISEPCQLQPCRHSSFHFPCIDHWLRADEQGRRRSCPVCKATVSRVFYGPASAERCEYGVRETTPTGHDPIGGLPFRRQVYRRLRYSMHVGSNRQSRYRELDRFAFRYDGRLQCRARLFLRRELRVFSWLVTPEDESPSSRRAATVEWLVSHIVNLLCQYEIRGSDGTLEHRLRTFLGRQNTSLLLHELHSFLRSPYESPQSWDRHVQYAQTRRPQDSSR